MRSVLRKDTPEKRKCPVVVYFRTVTRVAYLVADIEKRNVTLLLCVLRILKGWILRRIYGIP